MYVCIGIYVDRVVLGERFDRLIEKLTIAKEEAGRLLYVYVCMYSMYVWIVCMDCMYLCTDLCFVVNDLSISVYVCIRGYFHMHACMYFIFVSKSKYMYVCMYVCVYVCH